MTVAHTVEVRLMERTHLPATLAMRMLSDRVQPQWLYTRLRDSASCLKKWRAATDDAENYCVSILMMGW